MLQMPLTNPATSQRSAYVSIEDGMQPAKMSTTHSGTKKSGTCGAIPTIYKFKLSTVTSKLHPASNRWARLNIAVRVRSAVKKRV